MTSSVKTKLLLLLMISCSSVTGFDNLVSRLRYRNCAYVGGRWCTCPPFAEAAPGDLGLVVLPSREICIHGEKIDNGPLPDDPQAQREILSMVAMWFDPCTRTEIKWASRRCFRIQRIKLSQLRDMKSSHIHKFYLAFLSLDNKIAIPGTQNPISM